MFALVGRIGIESTRSLGKLGLYAADVVKTTFKSGCSLSSLFFQINHIGVNSRNVVALTGTCIGAVLAMHAYDGLHRYGADQFLGPLVYLSMTREFGSVISAIMVIARAGSAMTAEIGSMSISEQLDALTTLSIDPIGYVVVPRVLATTVALPMLALVSVLFGVGAGYVISIYVLGVNSELYIESIKTNLVLSDITYGLVKAAIFGFLSSIICTYKGMTARGGARGIGEATTQSVVFSCVTVFIADYVLSAFLFHKGD